MRTIGIRRFTKEGSTTSYHILEEAETILKQAQESGCLLVDEDTNTVINQIAPETNRILIADPIIGG